MKNGEKIFCELLLGTVFTFVENQDLPTVFVDKVLNNFEPESAKAISVGDNKCDCIPKQASFQNGSETLSVKIKPRSDILDDLCFGELLSHEDDLSYEVVFLFGRTDSGVADDVGF